MRKRFSLAFLLACLAAGLWLCIPAEQRSHADALHSSAQPGLYEVTFQQDVSPSGYAGTTDTLLDFYNPTRNEGGRADVAVTFDDKQRALLRFDLSDHLPAGARVLTATLTLQVRSRTASTAIGLRAYQVLQSWQEASATWLEAESGRVWLGGSGCEGVSRSAAPVVDTAVNLASGAQLDLDVTSVVQDWVDAPSDNHGLILVGYQVGGRVTYAFVSSEYVTLLSRPRLVVLYEGAPPLATPTPTLTPTRTPTPPNATTIVSTLSDWKFDQCLKTGKDSSTNPSVRVSPTEQMLIQWQGTVYTARLRLVICQTNPGAQHPIYVNGHLVARTPAEGTTSCECNLLPVAEENQFEFEIDPSLVLQGTNRITVTNAADPYDEWKASRGQIVLIGNITGTTRSEFELGIDWENRRLKGAMQMPMGYQSGVLAPLLISVPGTGEDRIDSLNRFSLEADAMGWLLASLDMRHVRWSQYYEQVARSPSLAVQRDVLDLVDYMRAHYAVDDSRIYIGGFSTGGGIAATLAAKYPDRFAGILDYSGPSDYAQWYSERLDLITPLELEFGGGPVGNFEYARRSSRSLARNLQHVAVRIRHSITKDSSVPFAQSQVLWNAMAQFYDPSETKGLITHTLGHADPGHEAKLEDLAFLGQHTLEAVPRDLQVLTDEGKGYYWLAVSKSGLADNAWRGWLEVDVNYTTWPARIQIRVAEPDPADARTVELLLHLADMGLSSGSAWDVERHDPATGGFALDQVTPVDGVLSLTLPVGGGGRVEWELVLYPVSGAQVGYADLRAGSGGYTGCADTHIVSDQFPSEGPGTPHGNESTLWLGCDYRRKTLLRFDLEPVPSSAVIKGASLTLHLLENRAVPLNVQIYELLRPWKPNEATWSVAAAGKAWSVLGAEGQGTDRMSTPWHVLPQMQLAGAYQINAKALVEDWLHDPEGNLGLLLVGAASCSSSTRYPLGAAEYLDLQRRPRLQVWYQEPTPTPIPSPTPTATSTAPTGASLAGTVLLQGRPSPPHQSWSVELKVTLDGSPYDVTTDDHGAFLLTGLPQGTYTVGVKGYHTLRVVRPGVQLASGGVATLDFGTLPEGDANNDNYVNISDFSILAGSFSPRYDGRVDFNEDGVVNIADFSLLASNFGRGGA